MNDEDLEPTLKTLRWRKPSPAFMQRSLEAVLAERAKVEQAFLFSASVASLQHDANKPSSRPTSWLGGLEFSVPKPLRLPLAACWLLALFFRLATPDPITPAMRETIAHMPPISTAQLFAQVDAREQAIQQALEDLLQPNREPLRRSIIHTVNPSLP